VGKSGERLFNFIFLIYKFYFCNFIVAIFINDEANYIFSGSSIDRKFDIC
jgi:hypothetical protein